jgi:hypothetical protein
MFMVQSSFLDDNTTSPFASSVSENGSSAMDEGGCPLFDTVPIAFGSPRCP